MLPFQLAQPYLRTDTPDYLGDLCELGRDPDRSAFPFHQRRCFASLCCTLSTHRLWFDSLGGDPRTMQFGKLQFSDEGAVAVSHYYNRTYLPRVERVYDCWETFGPLCQPPVDARPLMAYTLTLREWLAASIGHPHTGWLAPPVSLSLFLFFSLSLSLSLSPSPCPPLTRTARVLAYRSMKA
eukprot:COSAG03_NODE_377_length_8385_cov_12.259353_3_plen_182_part_00